MKTRLQSQKLQLAVKLEQRIQDLEALLREAPVPLDVVYPLTADAAMRGMDAYDGWYAKKDKLLKDKEG